MSLTAFRLDTVGLLVLMTLDLDITVPSFLLHLQLVDVYIDLQLFVSLRNLTSTDSDIGIQWVMLPFLWAWKADMEPKRVILNLKI